MWIHGRRQQYVVNIHAVLKAPSCLQLPTEQGLGVSQGHVFDQAMRYRRCREAYLAGQVHERLTEICVCKGVHLQGIKRCHVRQEAVQEALEGIEHCVPLYPQPSHGL